jgi:predicted RNA polymerase sigma factor
MTIPPVLPSSCHPALTSPSQCALTFRAVSGLTTGAFLDPVKAATWRGACVAGHLRL